MISEIWQNKKGSHIEIQRDETGEYCYYRTFPWVSDHKRKWQGFVKVSSLAKKGYYYTRTLQ